MHRFFFRLSFVDSCNFHPPVPFTKVIQSNIACVFYFPCNRPLPQRLMKADVFSQIDSLMIPVSRCVMVDPFHKEYQGHS